MDAICDKIDVLDSSVKHEITALRNEFDILKVNIESDRNNFSNEIEEIKKGVASLNESAVDFDSRINDIYSASSDNSGFVELLQARQTTLEKSVHSGHQHRRKFNCEIDGIPTVVGEDSNNLKEAVVKFFGAIGSNCKKEDIDVIHRLKSRDDTKPTIVLFDSRRVRDEVLKNKNKLKNLASFKLDIDGLNNDSKIYIRPSLCPYYKNLQFNCRILRRNNLIKQVRTEDDGTIKVKMFDDTYEKITHEKDLVKLFPQFGDFIFENSMYSGAY